MPPKLNMFEYFDSLVEKMSWIDMKLVGFIGIGFGLLLARIGWFANLSWVLIIVLMAAAYLKVFYSLFRK